MLEEAAKKLWAGPTLSPTPAARNFRLGVKQEMAITLVPPAFRTLTERNTRITGKRMKDVACIQYAHTDKYCLTHSRCQLQNQWSDSNWQWSHVHRVGTALHACSPPQGFRFFVEVSRPTPCGSHFYSASECRPVTVCHCARRHRSIGLKIKRCYENRLVS